MDASPLTKLPAELRNEIDIGVLTLSDSVGPVIGQSTLSVNRWLTLLKPQPVNHLPGSNIQPTALRLV